MDSANNSSSLQSSSGGGGGGGDEEFNSHTFFATASTNSNQHISSRMSNSVTNNVNNISGNSSSSIGIRSNNHNLSFFDSISFLDPSSSSFPLIPSTQNPNPNPVNPPTKTAPATAPRNPKKRSRASRRAPTTVLTTDTSNFRAMVQEFTGIPSPPFPSSSASPYPSRPRFDFSTPPFLLKPYPLKLQMPTAAVLHASNSANGLINHYQMQPPTSNFQSLLQSQHLDSGAVAGLGQQMGLIGSCWTPDPAQYGIMGGSKVSNAEIGRGGDQARGEGMVESWICSSD